MAATPHVDNMTEKRLLTSATTRTMFLKTTDLIPTQQAATSFSGQLVALNLEQ